MEEIEGLKQQIKELESRGRKDRREILHLKQALDRERSVALTKDSQNFANTMELRLQAKYLKLLLENCPDIIFLLNKKGRFIYCTDSFLKTAHIEDHSQIYGQTLKDVFMHFGNKEWLEELYSNMTNAYLAKTPLIIEVAFDFSKTGNVRRYIFQFTPMIKDDENDEGSMILLHDITDIENAREDAERSNRAKSDFLSNMSHEMRTPMNAIIGMTAIAKSSNDVERKNYCLKKIEDASTHLLGVINDILDMSKIEANKLELSNVNFNLEKTLQKAVNVIGYKVDEKNQKFEVHIDQNIPHYFIGDDQRLAQVVTNLLSNAVKFTHEGGTISLNAQLIEDEGIACIIQIEVTDSGIGISAEQQARLFTSFSQADSGTSRKFGGTGLGLAISKRIVEMMGGRIRVESEPGKGSSFIFTIRLELGEYGANKFPLNPGVSWETLRVLAVDDDLFIREYFSNIAFQYKLHCDTAIGGEEALELIKTNGPYDIYFVDLRLPGMDGIEVTRQIKEKNPGNSVVIMISAADMALIEPKAKAAGVSKFLAKPLFPSGIIDCLNECLGINAEAGEKSGMEDAVKFEGRRLLLAEDVEINREIVLSLLEPTDIVIDCAENGRRAVEMFMSSLTTGASSAKYDIIFMDVQMPEMDGYEATRKIREFEHNRNLAAGNRNAARQGGIPIIAMTANVFKEDVEKCIASGMNDHLGKPLNMDDVMEKLRKYLPS
ncbi:MAG: response regulator, partial [Treponema sp.]|nr:response regulator [Treponema sp.]